jgi:hypothetical protein
MWGSSPRRATIDLKPRVEEPHRVNATSDAGPRTRLLLRAAALILAVSALALAGCARNPAADDAHGELGPNGERPLQLRISARDGDIDPRTVSVKAGQRVNLIFMSESGETHELEVVELLPPVRLAPGERRNFTVVPERKKYRIVCRLHPDVEAEFIGE